MQNIFVQCHFCNCEARFLFCKKKTIKHLFWSFFSQILLDYLSSIIMFSEFGTFIICLSLFFLSSIKIVHSEVKLRQNDMVWTFKIKLN